jgi:aminoglycoside N3'-acetyltransferase
VDYNSINFKKDLLKIGVKSGDSVFVMCSANKVFKKTGYRLPVHFVLKDLIEVIGETGTVMALGFSEKRKTIIKRESIFDIKKTPTDCGIFSELLRRKKGAIRSIHPIFSAIAYGEKAKEYCLEHHKSPYPFGKYSPYYKITHDGGKYLGIGVGVEAYTPAHMIEDYFEQSFKHKMYEDNTLILDCIANNRETRTVETYTRREMGKVFFAPNRYLKLLGINYSKLFSKCGIKLFSMNMNEYFFSGVRQHNIRNITIYSTGLPKFVEAIGRFYDRLKNIL